MEIGRIDGLSTAPRSNEQRAVENFNAISTSPVQYVLNRNDRDNLIVRNYLNTIIDVARGINQTTLEALHAVWYLEEVIRLQIDGNHRQDSINSLTN